MGPQGTAKRTQRGDKVQLWSDMPPVRAIEKYLEEEMNMNGEEGISGCKATENGSWDETGKVRTTAIWKSNCLWKLVASP